MSAVPHPRSEGRPRLAVVRGRRRLPRFALAPWLIYTVLLAVAFLGIIYGQSSLNTRAMELTDLRAQVAAAEAEGQALRLEIARLSAPDRIVTRAEELGLVIPDTALRTLLVDDPALTLTTTADPETAAP